MNGKDPFSLFWGDGNPDKNGPSHLFFGNAAGTRVWELPYDMAEDSAKPSPRCGILPPDKN